MNLLDFFKEYLLTRDSRPSQATVKNYLADVRKFIMWFETTYRRPFSPSVVTSAMIARFKSEKLARIRRGVTTESAGFAASSVDRYTSSLRKFFSCLKQNGLISTSPFDLPIQPQPSLPEDAWHLKAFKNSLYQANNSPLTIKNYIIDIRHFMEWAQQVTKAAEPSFVVDKRSVFHKITPLLIEEYKSRLLHQLQLSPVSINRKLSSIRKYLLWASDQGLLMHLPLQVQNVPVESRTSHEHSLSQSVSEGINPFPSEAKSPVKTDNKQYSSFPPFRLAQKLGMLGGVLLDIALIAPVAIASEKLQYVSWLLTGKRLFIKSGQQLLESASNSAIEHIKVDPIGKIIGSVPNYKKSFYAPHALSTEGMPLHKRLLHHLRFSRPKWYKKYHSYPLVHYVHFAILVIFMSGVGFGLYRTYVIGPGKQSQVLAAKTSPPRVLSFQGRLTDSKDNPITAQTNLRFGVYNHQTASGSALLWQETQGVKPDQDGIFSVLLGEKTPIPQSLFGENASLFIGITVGRDQELIPRQQIATVAYATNAELLQGMPAITQPNAGTTNVVLALDSAGNLTIGGTASPTFQATGGTLTLSGQVLNLTTTSGSNGNVIISPDGTGTVDMQKPIQNTSNGNTIPGISGAVQFSDHVGIYNTGAQSGLSIYQTGTGNVITASQSGTIVFRVNNSGSGYFGQAVGIGELNPAAKLHVNSGGDSTSAIFNSSATPNTIFSFLSNGSEFGTISRNSNNDLELASFGSSTDIVLNPGGNVGIGTTIPSDFLLQVDGDIGPNIDSSFDLGSSDNYWNTLYVNEINASSTVDFSSQAIFNNGLNVIAGQSFVLEGLNGSNSVLYSTSGSGTVAAASVGAAGYCLVSGASAPTWASCASAASTSWDVVNGALTPKQASVLDLLIGGDSTASAKFAVLNVSGGTPVVYTSGNLGIGTSTPGANADIVGTLRTSGTVTFSSLTTDGGLLYTNGTGVVAQTGAGSLGECLISNGGGAPAWGSCVGSGGTNWNVMTGAYSPKFPTADLLIGGASTASAKFAVVNMLTGTPTASLSANSGNGALYLTGTGTLGTSASQSLTIGSATTGNITIDSGTGITTLADNTTVAGTLTTGTLLVNGDANINSANTLRIGNVSGSNAVLYSTSGTEIVAGATTATAGQCLLSGASNPIWGTCATGSGIWNQTAGALTPANSTVDLLIGGTSTASAKFAVLNVNGSGAATATVSGNLIVMPHTSGTSMLGGNVGIGTTAPNFPLHVHDAFYSALRLSNNTTGSGTSDGFEMGIGGSAIYLWNWENTPMQFATNNTERMVILGDGNVGIGTLGPGSKLQVNVASQSTDGITLQGADSHSLVLSPSRGAGGNNDLTQAGDASIIYSNGSINTGGMVIAPWNSCSGGCGIRMDANGNVGLGTSSPLGLLNVSGRATGKALVSLNETGNQAIFTASSAGTTRFVIDNSGNVGIGTITPGEKLAVSGGNIQIDRDQLITFGPLAGASTDYANIRVTQDQSDGTNMRFRIGDVSDVRDNFVFERGAAAGASGTELFRISSTGNAYLNGSLHVTNYVSSSASLTLKAADNSDPADQTTGASITLGNGETYYPGGGITLAAGDITNGTYGYAAGARIFLESPDYNAGANLILRSGERIFNDPATIQFQNYTATTVMILNESGNLGIGTTTPTAKLEVSGSASVSGNLTLAGAARTIQTTAMNTLTLGGDTTGNIRVNPRNGTAGGFVAPAVDNVTDLGASSTARFRDLYLGPSSFHVQCTTGDGCGQNIDWSMGIALSGSARNSLQIGANRSSFTSGVPSLTLTEGGSIGMGTTTPVGKLNIVGSAGAGEGIQIDNSEIKMRGDGFAHFSLYNTDGVFSINDTSSNFGMGVTGTNLLTILENGDGGNVGIGTSTPGNKLDVNGAGRFAGQLTLSGGASGATPTPQLSFTDYFDNAGNPSPSHIDLYGNEYGFGVSSNTLNIFTDGNMNFLEDVGGTPTNRMTIATGGNVGIGSTSPSTFKLQVAGNIGPEADSTYDLGASSSGRFRDLYLGPSSLHVQCTTGDGCTRNIDWGMGIATSGQARDSLLIGPNLPSFGSSGIPAMSISANGMVGIGTSTPSSAALLHLHNQYSIGSTRLFIESTTTPSIRYRTNNLPGSGAWFAAVDYLSGQYQIASAADDFSTNTVRLAIQHADGNIGIGTTTPDTSLNVEEGSIKITNNGSDTGNFWDDFQVAVGATHTCIAGTGVFGTCTSDARLKENISYIPLSEGLAAVRKLKPAKFDYINNLGEKNELGFIAQDVLGVVPDAVKVGDDGYYTFTADKLVPHLTLAVQDLDKQMQTLAQGTNMTLTSTGNISIFKDPTDPTGMRYAIRDGDQTVTRLAAFSEAVIANLRAGMIQAQEVIVSGTLQAGRVLATTLEAGSIIASELTVRGTVMASRVSAESITIAGMTLRDYIISVANTLQTYTPTVVSPLDGKLAVNILSPIAEDADVEVRLEQDSVKITNKAGETAAEIDNAGNATFAGTLTAEKVQTDELDLSEEGLNKLRDQIGTQSATTINNITNVYQTIATPSATPTPLATPTEAPTPTVIPSPTVTPTQTPTTTIQSDYANMASMSGVLGYVPSLKADFAQFTEGLMSLGPSSLNDVSVAGNLTVNGSMTLASNSINVLGADLEIQPLRQGNVSFMSGLVKIDIDGNMSVAGNATFAKNVTVRGVFAANVISPIPSQDLIFELPESRTTDPNGNVAIKQSDLIIKNASGSGVLRVNQLGDLIASGSGSFKQLATEGFRIVRGAQADTSLTVTVASASAGTAVITGGQTERTIVSSFVREDSLIYITALSDTEGLTPYVARQTAENLEERLKGSFTVQIPKKATKDIKINWWIVN